MAWQDLVASALSPALSASRSRVCGLSAPDAVTSGPAGNTGKLLNPTGSARLALIEARGPKVTNKGLQAAYLRTHAALMGRGN